MQGRPCGVWAAMAKRHHFVPKAYLKHFCDARGRVRVYRKESPSQILHMAPDNVAFRRYYYAQPTPDGGRNTDALEMFFSQVEDKWPPIVQQLTSGENVNDALEHIFNFIALQRCRVPAARDAIEVMLAASVKALARRMDAAGKLPPPPPGHENILEMMDVSIDPHQSIHAMVDMIRGMSDLYNRIGIFALHNKTDIPFLTSDNPVAWFDPSVSDERVMPYRISQSGAISMVFPVTPWLAICGSTEDKIRFHKNGLFHRETCDLDDINNINRTVCRFAYEAVFSRDLGSEDLVAKYAHESPVLEVNAINFETEQALLSTFVFGARPRLPKWEATKND